MRKVLSSLSRILLFGVAFFGFTACFGVHNLTVLPSASLDRGNFKYIKYVEGRESSVYVLGIGGMSAAARTHNAYNVMCEKAQLGPNQAIANVSARENTHLYFPFGAIVTSRTTIVSGWVVEFDDAPVAQRERPVFNEAPKKEIEEPAKEPEPKKELVKEQTVQQKYAFNEDNSLTIIDDRGKTITSIVPSTSKNTNANQADRAVQVLKSAIKKGRLSSASAEKYFDLLVNWLNVVPVYERDKNLVISTINNAKKNLK